MTEAPWQIRNVIKDIQVMLSQDAHVIIQHIYRKANMTADWLSKYRHSITDALSITVCFNIVLRNIVMDDMIERALVRIGA